jgi:hypothetical protein
MNSHYFLIGVACSIAAIAVSLWKGKTLNMHTRGGSAPWIIGRDAHPGRFWVSIGVFAIALAVNLCGVAGLFPQ